MDGHTKILNGYPTFLPQRVAFGTQDNFTLAYAASLVLGSAVILLGTKCMPIAHRLLRYVDTKAGVTQFPAASQCPTPN